MTESLQYRERPAAGDPEGLLLLHHGRGSDEADLLGLADELDSERRLHVVSPRAPLTLGGPGYHWYVVPRVGFPDPDTFHAAYRQLAEFHDATWERLGLTPAQTVVGGFSMGSVMSYALGLGPDRPAPAGILAFSGFVPSSRGGNRSSLDPHARSSHTVAAIRSSRSASGSGPAVCSRRAGWTSSTGKATTGTGSSPRIYAPRPAGSARRFPSRSRAPRRTPRR